MAKDFSKLTVKQIEQLARKNRNASLKELKEVEDSRKSGKPIENKTARQEELQQAEADATFNEMKKRDN